MSRILDSNPQGLISSIVKVRQNIARSNVMPFFVLEIKTFSLGSRIEDMALWDEPIVELSAKV